MLDGSPVLGELFIGNARLAKQREHKLATVSIGQDAHGIVDHHARRERDIVIHHAKTIPLREPHPNLAKWGVHNPVITFLLDLGTRQTRRPTWKLSGISGKFVDIARVTLNVYADMLDRVHTTTFYLPTLPPFPDDPFFVVSFVASFVDPQFHPSMEPLF